MLLTARRPFHPERLHTAMDVLLDGVVRTRSRIGLATRPDAVLWLESAGGGLQVGCYTGDWLDAGNADAWQAADPGHLAMASCAGTTGGATGCRSSPSSRTAPTPNTSTRPCAPPCSTATTTPAPPSAMSPIAVASSTNPSRRARSRSGCARSRSRPCSTVVEAAALSTACPGQARRVGFPSDGGEAVRFE